MKTTVSPNVVKTCGLIYEFFHKIYLYFFRGSKSTVLGFALLGGEAISIKTIKHATKTLN